MQRVSIVGTSGSGKSTVGAALARALDVPFVELDAINHQPNWVQLPVGEFRVQVEEIASAPGWVIDGNYSSVQDLVWERADTVVWLDYPRCVVMAQVIWRTLSRIVRRTELWNGNRESWRSFLTLDPEESVIVWAWMHVASNHDRYLAESLDPGRPGLRFVRLSNRDEAAALIERSTRTS